MRATLLGAAILLSVVRAAWGGGFDWRIDASDGSAATAVAVHAGRWAVGEERAVRLHVPGEPVRRLPTRGPVRSLAFSASGTLLVGTEAGLFTLDVGDTALRPEPLGAGEGDQMVIRVVAAEGLLAVASEAGVSWRDTAAWRRVDGAFGAEPVTGLALGREHDGAAALWIASERGLFRASVPAASATDRSRVLAERVELPTSLRPAVDVLVRNDVVHALGASELLELRDGAWRVHRLVLPPGAEPRRLAHDDEALWIGTDRGLLVRRDGSFRRAASPAGTADCADVVSARDRVFVATTRGLLLGVRTRQLPAPTGARDPCDPPVAAVHRQVLLHADLTGAHTARWRRGVQRRGWLPEVELDVGYGRGRDAGWDNDQSFVSGDKRQLYDRDRSRGHDSEVSLRLSWELGDVAYHPEEIDVSTEARRLLELRDDVLDEVNQLYFDRRRALAASREPGDPAEAARQSLRVEELAAGLDAWTGGWFSRTRAACTGGPG